MAYARWLSLPLALGFTAALAQSAHNEPRCSPDPGRASHNVVSPATRLADDWRASAPVILSAAPPPAPREAVDLGLAPGGARLERMILLLEPSAAQRQALDAEIDAQQAPDSCEFHHWVTPQEFADTYANSAADVNAVADWLRSEGLVVAPLPTGRGWIEFSGSAAQVTQAFHAQINAYSIAGATRFVLRGALSVPAALRPVIHGLVSLDGVLAAPAITAPRAISAPPSALAAETVASRAEALTPQLAARLLDFDSEAQGGAGETIAIPARGSIRTEDIDAFRAAFGLPAGPVVQAPAGAELAAESDRAAVELSASWAGAVAPSARIVIVPATDTAATDGVDLALAAIVDQSLAHTVVIGYSACESSLSQTRQAFYASLYRQAAAQGISAIAAAGDSGPAACHAAGSDLPVTTGYAVNALASTPWNTAVGAAAFAATGDSSLTAWSPVNPADPAYAGGGGRSSTYTLPAWQSAVPPGSGRQLPDLALPTAVDSGQSRGLAFCFSASGAPSGCNLVRSGGSAAAAAIFGGIAARIARQNGPQGNLAPRLYALGSRAGVFNDVAAGTARLACAAGSPGCDASGTIGYAAGGGYDLATGIGVPNVHDLLAAWATPNVTGNSALVTLVVSPVAPNATYNPSASMTFTATVATLSGGATPTGTVNFLDQSSGSNLNPSPVALDSSGKGSVTVSSGLPQGGNNIVAKYSGDSTYGAQTSQVLTVNIQPSTTTTTVTPSTTTPAVGVAFPVTVTVAAGTPPAGTKPPTGQVTLTLDGAIYDAQNLSTTSGVTSASFNVTVASGGSHNLQAIYVGDSNYANSTGATVSVTASKGATVTTLVATPATLTPGTPQSFTATIAPANSVAGTTNTFTGTVTFFDGAGQIGTATVSSSSATLSNITLSTSTTHVITAVYSGDGNWAGSTSNAVTLKAVLFPVTVTLAVTPATAAPGQVVTLMATVTPTTAPASTAEQNPTGNILFYNGTTVLATVALSPAANYSSTAQLLFATLPAGQNSLTAVYLGDLFYAAGTSNTVVITVQDFTITPGAGNPPSELDINKGQSGQASFIFTGLGGFNSELSVTCAVPGQDDMTCTPNPVQITPTGTVVFTVTTYLTGGPSSARRDRAPLWPPAAGGTALAALVFFLLPARRRARLLTQRGSRMLGLVLLFGALAASGIGCSSTSGGDPGQITGTPLGQTTLTITAGANIDNTIFSHSVYLSVNVLPPRATGTSQPMPGAK